MKVEIDTEIRRVVDSGEAVFGEEEVKKNVLKGIGKLIIVSGNTEEKKKEEIQYMAKLAEMPCHEFKGTTIELGSVCGKPFPISMLLVLSPGKSKIIDIVKETVTDKK